MAAASAKPLASRAGSCASLPNVIASPPSSRHQRTTAAGSGTAVLTSNARLEELLANRQSVQGREHPVELSGIQQLCSDIAMPMGFAQLHSADDAKVRELVPAPLHALQVAVQIQSRRSQRPVRRDERRELFMPSEVASNNLPSRVIGVLGERHGRKTHLDRSRACPLHRVARRIPGPFTHGYPQATPSRHHSSLGGPHALGQLRRVGRRGQHVARPYPDGRCGRWAAKGLGAQPERADAPGITRPPRSGFLRGESRDPYSPSSSPRCARSWPWRPHGCRRRPGCRCH